MKRNEFERVTPESVGIPSELIQKLVDKLESGFTEPHGLMIMRHGKICAEGWWAPYAPGIRHGLQSHTKTYAATAVGIAYTEGLLKLEDRIIDIFPEEAPENPSENLKKLTVRDVLCMGCGMDTMPAPSKDWIREFLATPVNHVPGTTYMYNSTGSTLLGAIVRKLTGLGLHDYLKPRLFDKIGIDADNHRWIYMPDGMEVGGGGLYATTEDNLRLMKLYADGGVWEGERILSEDYVKKASTLQNESATEAKNNPLAKDNHLGYGFQIWMCKPEGVYRADGAMGQFTIVVPAKDMIIAITENAAGAHWAQTTLDTMWEFLKELPDKESLAENKPASESLAKRMSMLALPAPKFAPYNGSSEKINNVSYHVREDNFILNKSAAMVSLFMGGTKLPKGIEEFSFHFEADSCTLHYLQEGEYKIIEIGMDGDYRRNIFSNGAVTLALMSGAWISEDTFQLTTRWVETCNHQKLNFTFSEDAVIIEEEGEESLFQRKMPPVTALKK
jgi:CubicO group peptidase (beta-lactamase class C family)